MKTCLFYDIETSGLNPAFDQILTFASIRTDTEFNEIERNEITIQLRTDIVPSPFAFIVHRLSYDELRKGLTEYEAVRKIHGIMNRPGTVSLGYNTLRFDDEFLRFSFYRNLLDPYTHQYGNGCSRMDILPIVTLFYIFKPDIINWPENNGRPSLKLERISEENSLVNSGRAHEAMTDVEATCNLAKLLSKEQEMFKYSLDYFNKKKDEIRISRIDNSIKIKGLPFKLGIMVSHTLGPDLNYMAPVLCIGKSQKYSNQNLWLRLDRENIIDFSSDPLETMPFVVRKKYGDVPIILPSKERFYKKLPSESIKAAEDNLEAILKESDTFFNIVNFHRGFKYPYIPDLDPDASLYQTGFFVKDEKKDIVDFHNSDIDGKLEFATTSGSERIKILAQRIIQRNFSHELIKRSNPEFSDYFDFASLMEKTTAPEPDNNIIGFKNDIKLNCRDALNELEKARKTSLDNEQKEILAWVEKYIKDMQDKYQ